MNFFAIWISALIIKICLLPFLPITPDETYYFSWARHMQLSYFDHPPFIAYLLRLGELFWATPFTVRLPGVVLSHCALLPWFSILKKLGFDKKQIIFWLLLVLVNPLTGIGGFLVTPDAPLLFFWSLGFLAFLNLEKKSTWRRWLALGLCIGLGMLSKYMMILFVIALLIYFIRYKNFNFIKSSGFWLMTAAALAVFWPVIIWNFQNHFASFAFQAQHGLASAFSFKWPLEFLGGQWLLLNPVIGTLFIFTIPKISKQLHSLLLFSITPVLFFFLTSFKGHVEPNWTVCAYPGIMALSLGGKNLKKYFNWFIGALVLSAVFFVTILSHSIHPWLPIKNDHTNILHQWRADVDLLKNYHPLYARSYQVAAYQSYFRKEQNEVFKLPGFDRKDFYDFLDTRITQFPSYILLNSDDLTPPSFNKKYQLHVIQSLPSGLVLYEIKSR